MTSSVPRGAEPIEPVASAGWTPRRLGAVAAALGLAGGLLGLTAPSDGGAPVAAPTLRLDPNTAPPEALLALPALGPSRVAALRVERTVAPFTSLADLERRVKGIGPATARALAPHLRFPGPAEHPPSARSDAPGRNPP